MLETGRVIDAPVTVGTIDGIAEVLVRNAAARQGCYVCIANVHMVTTAKGDADLRRIMEGATVATADGLPLVWVLRHQGFKRAERVTGTDLTLRLCEEAENRGMPICFYGSSPATIQALQKSISNRFPSLKALYESPPLLPMKPVVEPAVIERFNASGARIVFVGLGCPKQEFWMEAYSPHLSAVLIGVGAAFDFIAGTIKRAPQWIQRIGCEWLYRLITDTRKTWKRYATTNPLFVYYLGREYFLKKP